MIIKNNSISSGSRVTLELFNGKISDILINDISINYSSNTKNFRKEQEILFVDNLDNIKTIEIKSFNIDFEKIYNAKKEREKEPPEIRSKYINYLSNLSLLISVVSLILAFWSCILVV